MVKETPKTVKKASKPPQKPSSTSKASKKGSKKVSKPVKKKPSTPKSKATHEAKKLKIKKKATSAKAKTKKTAAKKEVEEIVPGDARKFFKDGQKYITPPKGDGTRGFYESLLEENPHSLISIKYCIEYGILSGIKHRETFAFFKKIQEMGGYKGSTGGIKQQFKKQKLDKILQSIRAKHNSDKTTIKSENI